MVVSYFGYTSRQCSYALNHTCVDTGVNPDAGMSSYDNLLSAMLANFVAMTGEGWTNLMYYVR
jgi:hypothetical protein